MNDSLQNHINQLIKIQSEVDETRAEGESYITNLQKNNCPELLRLSCNVILSDPMSPIFAIKLSFIIFNRSSIFLMNNWGNFTIEQQNTMRSATMRGLFFQDQAIRNLSSYSFCLVARCGINTFRQDILQSLSIPICNKEYPPICTIGCFMALKELISHKIINPEFPFYHETGVTIMNAFQTIMGNPKVFEIPDFVEFLKCFSVILPFFKPFLSNQQSKETFLKMVTGIYSFLEIHIHSSLYDLLFTFFKCFYDDIKSSMYCIFDISKNSLCMLNNPEFIIPAINFWSDIAKYEISIVKRIRSEQNNSSICYNKIINLSAPNLVHPLMIIITKFAPTSLHQSFELENLENLNSVSVYQAAADCLRRFSALTNDVFNYVSGSFDERRLSQNWCDRFAAICSLWCISKHQRYNIDVSSSSKNIHYTLNSFYENRFTDIISMTNDPNPVVQNEAFSIIAVIFRVSCFISRNNFFLKRVSSLFNSIIHNLKVTFAKNAANPSFQYSDLIPTRIIDIIHDIARQNRNVNKDQYYPVKTVQEAAQKTENEEKENEKENEDNEENEEENDIFKIIGFENPGTPFSVYFFKYLRNLFNIYFFPPFQSKNSFEMQERCTEAIATMFSATPREQVSFVCQTYLPIIVTNINTQLDIVQSNGGVENNGIDSSTRVRQFCTILSAIVESCGNAISNFAQPVMGSIIRALKMKHVSVHEEALITLIKAIDAIGDSIIPYLQDIFIIFGISQVSGNNIIIERSSIMIFRVFVALKEKPGIITPVSINQIFQMFLENVKNESVLIDSRLEIIKNFGGIIRILKIAAEPFFPMFLDILINYQKIQFVPLIDADIRAASLMFETVLDGYANLLEASAGLEFTRVYMKNFKNIIKFLGFIGGRNESLTDDVKLSIVRFLMVVMSNVSTLKMADRSIKIYMHGRMMIEMLKVLKNDRNKDVSTQAAEILLMIEKI